jgi:hypothetical protein
MPEILGFTSKKMIFEIESWYFCVVFSTNRTNLLNWLIKSANRKSLDQRGQKLGVMNLGLMVKKINTITATIQKYRY